jgi:hypothetical protein
VPPCSQHDQSYFHHPSRCPPSLVGPPAWIAFSRLATPVVLAGTPVSPAVSQPPNASGQDWAGLLTLPELPRLETRHWPASAGRQAGPLPLESPNPPTSPRVEDDSSPPQRIFAKWPFDQPAAMEQWQTYPDSAGAGGSRRYNGSGSQMSPRDYNNGQMPAQQQQQQPPAGFKYDQYQGGLNPQPVSTASPITSPQMRDNNGDVSMQDASQDPYSNVKYPMRPHHQHHLSGGRTSGIHSPQEPSAAAQRYSPMEVLSPTSPYASKPGAGQYSQQPAQRQSPTRQPDYQAQSSPYYGSRQAVPQLPSISAYQSGQDSYSPLSAMDGAYDPKSPRRAGPPPPLPFEKGPVPELKKIRGPGDLKPKVNTQPAFRRANPEGGFISVSFRPTAFRPASNNVCSLSKRSQSTSPRLTAFAILASNTNHRGILVVY